MVPTIGCLQIEHCGSFEWSMFNLSTGGGLIIPCSLNESRPRSVEELVEPLLILREGVLLGVCLTIDACFGMGNIFAVCKALATK